MNSISFPIKVLLISAVISLLPVAVGVSPLDYKGSSIEAADEKKEKKKRRRTKLPSKTCPSTCKNLPSRIPFAKPGLHQKSNLSS